MNIKLFDGRCMPTRAHITDAGYDCVTYNDILLYPGQVTKVPLGFAIELWDGHEAQIRGRSGLAAKGIFCHVGTIDSAYRAEVAALLIYHVHPSERPFLIKAGERVAQMVIARVETPLLYRADVLSDSDRGANGFGSTGK